MEREKIYRVVKMTPADCIYVVKTFFFFSSYGLIKKFQFDNIMFCSFLRRSFRVMIIVL